MWCRPAKGRRRRRHGEQAPIEMRTPLVGGIGTVTVEGGGETTGGVTMPLRRALLLAGGARRQAMALHGLVGGELRPWDGAWARRHTGSILKATDTDRETVDGGAGAGVAARIADVETNDGVTSEWNCSHLVFALVDDHRVNIIELEKCVHQCQVLLECLVVRDVNLDQRHHPQATLIVHNGKPRGTERG